MAISEVWGIRRGRSGQVNPELDIGYKIISMYSIPHPELWGLCNEALSGIYMTAIYQITDLEAFRFAFYDRHGVLLKRPYVSVA